MTALSEDLLHKSITFLYNRNNQLETIIKKKILFITLSKLKLSRKKVQQKICVGFMEKNYEVVVKYVKDDLKEMELSIIFVDATVLI